MLECRSPLRQLTGQGMAVLLLHHPAKKADTPGRLARGTGAFSRPAETPRQRVIELNAEGTDYRSRGNLAEAEFAERGLLLRAIFASAERKLPRRSVMARWPAGEAKPDPATLWRWLDRAVTQALLLRGGAGRKNDPYRFWLPEKDALFNEPTEEFFARLVREGEEKGAGGKRPAGSPE